MCAHDLEYPVVVHRAALVRHAQDLLPRQVLPGQRIFHLLDAGGLALVDDLAAVLTGTRTDIHQPVGLADGVLIVFDHDERIADVPQALQRVDEPLVVALVQADGRLVQHVEHAGQARADLGGQANALSLATRQRGGAAVEAQVGQADIDKKVQPRLDLLEHCPGDDLLAVAQLQRVQKLRGILDGQRRQTRDGLLAVRFRGQPDRQDLLLQPRAVAHVARDPAGVLQQAILLRVGIGGLQLAVDKAHRALERGGPVTHAPVPVLVTDADLFFGAVDKRLALLLGQLAHRGARIEVERVAQARDQAPEVLRVRARVPRLHRLFRRRVRVRDDELLVHLEASAQAVAGRAGTEG